MPRSSVLPAAVRRSLRETFGLKTLRSGQQAVIERVLAGQDTLAILPTGAGKSLCYQLPALHLQGLTVVVSPLIALMKDQKEKLDEAGVAAEQLNSAQRASEQGAAIERIAAGESGLVFTTPERLADPAFMQTLRGRRVALFVVDEAHCISQWGHDFRPAYLQLDQALRELGQPPVLALTATAPDRVADDIARRLGRPRMLVVQTGMYRPNLRLQVAQCVREGEKLERTLAALAARPDGAGIVYCASVKVCNELADALVAAGHPVAKYHGRLPAAERHAAQDRFMRGEVRVMVATSAFGMGIDKSDLRFVLHYQMPGSPEAYYQEAGRAGRDGKTADCALLFDRRDKQVQQFFLAGRRPDATELRALHDALRAASGGTTPAALAEALPGWGGSRLETALHALRDAGLARADRQRRWHGRLPRGTAPDARVDPARFEALTAEHADRAAHDREALERMVFYAQTGFCRWRVLLEYFGEQPLPFEHERCGLCDNCLRPPPEPPAACDAADAGAPQPAPLPAFRPGQRVRVPRHGSGLVEQAGADEVAVRFPDGALRRFVARYVEAEPALAEPG